MSVHDAHLAPDLADLLLYLDFKKNNFSSAFNLEFKKLNLLNSFLYEVK